MTSKVTAISIPPVNNGLVMTKKYRSMKRLLMLSGLCFRQCSDSTVKQRFQTLRLLLSLLFISLVGYQIGTFIWFLFHLTEYDGRVSRTVVMTIWSMKAFFSMVFLFYWELRGYNRRILERTMCYELDETKTNQSDKTTRTLLTGFVVVSIVTSTICSAAIMANRFGYTDVEFLLLDMLTVAYGNTSIGPTIVLTINFFAFSVFNIVLVYFVVSTASIRVKIGTEEPTSSYDQLQVIYVEFRRVIRIIRETNSIFEVYTFVSLGTNIPLCVFSMLTFFMSMNSNIWDMVYSIPELSFVFIEVIGLTFTPASVRNILSRVEPMIYENSKIWLSFHEKTFEIAQLYINMAKQSDLGISIWGFAILDKPIILTTASLTVSYFVLIVQMGQQPSTHHNATMTV
ncbi:hypothetical protein M3Y95_00886000 [Aphelenchoides besseyi]|nr:hypothetical protein M3Y95_00886000 [Aphelenchoides besseyi]